MKFCPQCGSICIPKKDEDGNTVIICKCGHTEGGVTGKMSEKGKEEMDIEVADADGPTTNAIVDMKCTKCGNDKAETWLLQNRSGDEAPNEYYRCTKCKKTWKVRG